jgi:glutathione synthase/RimK-type ligase-like ATP-grasp enzyme
MDLPVLQSLPALLHMTPPQLRQCVDSTRARADQATQCMQMYFVWLALDRNDIALEMQSLALQSRAMYRLAGPVHPRVRMLMFLAPGNMQDNTPLEFVLDGSDVQLDLVFITALGPLPEAFPEHDVVFVAIGDSDKNRPILQRLDALLRYWPKPVLNRPSAIGNCARDTCYQRLHRIPGVWMPTTARVAVADLGNIAFPCTIRPVDTQGGIGLRRMGSAGELDAYVAEFTASDYFVAEYVDYQSDDGQFRKWRLVLIDGQAYICHLAIASHWVVHYLSAGMDASADKRQEEAAAMANFEQEFLLRFGPALRAIAQALELDYVTLDCSIGRDGRLLVFEADSRGLVHAADPVDVFPYKPAVMQKAFTAFRRMVEARITYQGLE